MQISSWTTRASAVGHATDACLRPAERERPGAPARQLELAREGVPLNEPGELPPTRPLSLPKLA
jgi:hypothetical protein